MTIPKPVFSGFTVFWAVFALKARKLPDLSGRQIRQSIWWGKVDSNHRRHCQQIYSLSHLATLEFPHIQLRWSWWTDSNPRPADYKRWQSRQNIDFQYFLPLSCRGLGSIQAYCVHPVHTVIFPFGSGFGSNGSAAQLVDRFYQQISQRRGLKICAGINKEKAKYITSFSSALSEYTR